MKLIVGLGNPGRKYEGNRHNIGFMAVDAICLRHGFTPWRKRFQGLTSEGQIGGERVLLLKPETYMNESGRAIGEAVRFLKLKPADVIVLHDELDLAPGKLRTKIGGGHAGHNGLRSTDQHIGKAFARVRLGIGHPGHKDRVAGYVLHDFAKADRDWLEPMIDAIAAEAGWLARGDLERFQTAVSQVLSDAGGAQRATKPAPEPRRGGDGRRQASPNAKPGQPVGPRRPSQRELAARAAEAGEKRRQGAKAARKETDTAPKTTRAEEQPEQRQAAKAQKTALGDKLSGVLSKLLGKDPSS
jgi:PTH1 family peptidyl-tRNA hydrolase